jgi:SHS2 domain-containing protein
MSEGFRTFDHTGDLGLEVWADTPERLYGHAAEALMAQIAEAGPFPVEVRHTLDLEGDGGEELLVHWLNTVLLESALRRALWTKALVKQLTPSRLQATLEGQELVPARQVMLREIKAVSHHHLALDLVARPCTCRLVLDL